MIKNLTVGIDSDFSGLERGVASLFAQLGRIGQAALQAGGQITGGFGRATTAANQYRDAQGRLREANGRFAGSNGNALGSLAKLTVGYISAAKALELVKQGLGIISDFQRIDASLKAVSSSSADYARTQTFLRSTSDSLGLSYEVLASTYKGLKAAASAANMSSAETERIFTSVVHAGAALRLSNDEVQGTLLALQQMMSKGTVQAEELRGQLGERLPGAFNLMAKALGVSTQELNKMLEQGQVLASDALPKLATELERTFGANAQSNVNSMAGGFTRTTDQLKLFLAEFSKENGIDKFFAGLGNGIANYIRGLREAQSRGESLWGLTKDRQVELSRQSAMRSEFTTAKPGRRQEMLDQAMFERDSYKNELKSPNLSDDQRATINAAIAQSEERLLLLRRANINVLGREFTEQRKAEQQALSSSRVFFDLERDKKRVSDLKTIIANKRGNGQDFSREQREYDTLTARIEANTDSVRKHKKVIEDLSLSTNERLLKRYSDAWKKHGDTVGGARSNMVRILKDAVAADKAIEGGQLQNNIQAFDRTRLNRLLGNRLAGNNVTTAGLNGSTATVGLPGLAGFQMNHDADVRDQKEQAQSKIQAIRAAMADIPSSFNSVRAEMTRLVAADPLNTKGLIDKVLGSADALSQAVQAAKGTMAGAFGDMLAGIGESIGQGKDAFGSVIRGLINTIADAAIQLGKTLIMLAIPMLGAVITAPLAVKQMITGGAIVLAGGLAKGLAATAFANGGTVSGLTNAIVGEYPGASRNPEFIAPVNKGAGMIAQQLMQMGAFGGGGPTRGEFILRGPDLLLAIDRAKETKRNYGS